MALRSDRWVGADLWQRAADTSLTLDALLERSDVVVTLAGMASSVVAYWVGSSNGSMQKNAALEKALAQK